MALLPSVAVLQMGDKHTWVHFKCEIKQVGFAYVKYVSFLIWSFPFYISNRFLLKQIFTAEQSQTTSAASYASVREI